MNISTHTLTLMRHSAGVVITAAAISGNALAASLENTDFIQSTSSELHSRSESKFLNSAVEEPKKKDEEKDPCPACGRG